MCFLLVKIGYFSYNINMKRLFLLILSFIFLGGAVTGSALLLSGCDSAQTETNGGGSQNENLNENQNGETSEKDDENNENVQAYANSIRFIYESYEGYSSYEPTILVACDNGSSMQILNVGDYYVFENVGTYPQISLGPWSGGSAGYIFTSYVNGELWGNAYFQGTTPGIMDLPLEEDSGETLILLTVSQAITVSYHANGGSGSMDTEHLPYGTTYEIKDCEFTNSYGDFLGWATTSTGGVRYQPGTRINLSSDLSLYARSLNF